MTEKAIEIQKYINDHTNDEVAKIVGCSLRTVLYHIKQGNVVVEKSEAYKERMKEHRRKNAQIRWTKQREREAGINGFNII